MIVARPTGALCLVLLLSSVLWAVSSGAQTDDKPVATKEAAVDPASVAALSRVGKYLASLQSLAFDATISTEVVLDNQQKLLVSGLVRYLAVKPDKLRVELNTDSMKRHFYHNGKKFTVVAPEEGYFAEMEAVSSTPEALVAAARDFGVELPLADLLEWGHARGSWKDIGEGFLVGKPKVDGVETEHWAFRSPNLDWEIWIKTGDRPLPLRISTVNTKDPAKPRFEATLKWSDTKVMKDELFTPALSKGHKRIDFKKRPARQEAAE